MDDEPVPQAPFNLNGARVGFAKTHNWPAAGPGTQKAMEKAQEILKAQGATVEDIDLPADQGFDRMLEWHTDVLNAEGKASFLGHYRADKKLLHEDLAGFVENRRAVSRKKQLDAYDNCARLRTVWDKIASKYDLVITPSIVDEAPVGLENTGDMVSPSTFYTALHALCALLTVDSLSARCGRCFIAQRSTYLGSQESMDSQLVLLQSQRGSGIAIWYILLRLLVRCLRRKAGGSGRTSMACLHPLQDDGDLRVTGVRDRLLEK